MGKSLSVIKDDFAKQLDEAAAQITKLSKDIESLKVRQHQLIGAVYALDLAIQESSLPDAKEEEKQ